MKRILILRSKQWLTKVYKAASSQHMTMYEEIEFRKIVTLKRNMARIERRHPCTVDWLDVEFYEGYAVVPCYDRKGRFAFDAFLYSKEQIPDWLALYWCDLPPVDLHLAM
ncbi:hypothetical protein [Pantoea rwandensis]|uniref:Uncharacterized protein n=1 Tax=Pantoea rwandensis TaxID=1076550 RepID=A0A1X1CQG1_9GAMM|nr:hypothetical protein [Pantoea rwandensis]ORM66666.1 hypothetical protein HA51_23095 [Pantoea rwandensis]